LGLLKPRETMRVQEKDLLMVKSLEAPSLGQVLDSAEMSAMELEAGFEPQLGMESAVM
jgi:hypothetical protein